MKFDYQELFPLLRYGTKDEFEGHCRFYFPEDPSECISFVNSTLNRIESDNRYAWDACRAKYGDAVPPADCCKTYAKDNDVAYQVCIDESKKMQEMQRHSMRHVFSVRNVVLAIIVLVFIVLAVIIFRYPRWWNKKRR